MRWPWSRRETRASYTDALTLALIREAEGVDMPKAQAEAVEGLVDRLVELGKTFDYITYPNRNHGLSEGEGTALHVRMLMVRYLLICRRGRSRSAAGCLTGGRTTRTSLSDGTAEERGAALG